MRPRVVLVLLALLALAAVCVRLGLWQLGRYEQKRAMVAALRAGLAAPPRDLERASAPPESVVGRVVEVRGRYDPTHHVLLAFRDLDGAPGVEVVTPLRRSDGEWVLVNRGWLPSEDGVHARPQDFPEPGTRAVRGVGEAVGRGRFGVRMLENDSVTVLSTRALDAESLAARLPGPLARYVVRQLPGPGVPERPRRARPPLPDPTVHLSYVIQWFSFAAILVAGGAIFARSQRGGARSSR